MMFSRKQPAVAILSLLLAACGGSTNDNNGHQGSCGDGQLDDGEECDDGNKKVGDGCSGLCVVEPGWQCSGSPSECTCFSGETCERCVVYVNYDTNITQRDGASWTTAYATPQEGIDAAFELAISKDSGCEVWVAAGTYYIYESSFSDAVQLWDGVAVYGGFLGNETERDQRDWATHVTVLNGADSGGTNHVHYVVIAFEIQDATLDGFTITGGESDGSGGGMLVVDSSPTVSNCTFSGNSAVYDGGGMLNLDTSSPTVTNCIFSDNSAMRGGGMYNDDSSPAISGCTFSNNSATADGGGLYNFGSSPEVTDSIFSGNSAQDRAGGMFNEGSSPTVTNCDFSSNSAANHGGGMQNLSNSAPAVTSCTFSDNSANFGGGMYNCYNSMSPPTLTDCIFKDNLATTEGGGIYSYNSPSRVAGCTFSGNSATDGGGIFIDGMSSPTVDACTFSGNSATAKGGGMYNDGTSTPTVENSIFIGNSAEDGGGMLNHGSSAAVKNCTFSDNSATNGGGMYNMSCSYKLAVTNCTFSGNSATDGGGGIFNNYSSPTTINCIFSGNAATDGGGMRNHYSSTPEVTNCIFAGNSSTNGGGMGDDDSTPKVANCTFSGNSAAEGGGMHVNNISSSGVTNSIIWGNTASASDPSIYKGPYSQIFVNYSDVEGGHTGTGNIDLNPSFAPSETGSWTGVSHDSVVYRTVLTNGSASWTPGELIGLFVQPDVSDPRWYFIADNAANQIWIWGDLTGRINSTAGYRLHDLHLSEDSPCIDTGNDGATFRLSTDIEDNPWTDVAGKGSPGTATDMGAYEYVP